MECLGILFIGTIPYYLLIKNNPFKPIIMFFLSTIGIVLLYEQHIVSNVYVYEVLTILAIATSLSTFIISYKTSNLIRLSYKFLFLNAVSFFIMPFKIFTIYFWSIILSSFLLYIISFYIHQIFESANFEGIRGFALKSPKLALVLRLNLMALGCYPPFSNFFFLFEGFLKTDSNMFNYAIFIWLFLANFFMAFRIMKNTVFGTPNENIVYRDLDGYRVSIITLGLLVLTILGILGFVEVII